MSYSGDPQDSAKDLIRFLLQDTSSPESFTDTEITAVYAMQDSDMAKTLDNLCVAFIAKAAAHPQDERVEGISTTWGDMAKKYQALRMTFKEMAQNGSLPTHDGVTDTVASTQMSVLTESYCYPWEGMSNAYTS